MQEPGSSALKAPDLEPGIQGIYGFPKESMHTSIRLAKTKLGITPNADKDAEN